MCPITPTVGGFAFSSELLWSSVEPLANGTASGTEEQGGLVHGLQAVSASGGNLVATRTSPWEYRGIMKWMPVMAKALAKRRRQAARRKHPDRGAPGQKRARAAPRHPRTGPPTYTSFAHRPVSQPDPTPPLPVRIEWRGGESEFLQALMPKGFPEDLQPLGNCGHDVLVYHNGFLAEHSRDPKHAAEEREAHRLWQRNVHAPTSFCKLDGW